MSIREAMGRDARVNDLPPIVGEKEFSTIQTSNEEEIKSEFNPFVRKLHSFLNRDSCLSNIQQIRGDWISRVADQRAFGTFATEPRHWYTYNNGGRKEAQFNIGLCPDYLRVGLGFEFTLKKGGDPAVVHWAYAQFVKLIREKHQDFENFVRGNLLEVEWVPSKQPVPGEASHPLTVQTRRASKWLLQPPQEPAWIFVGRLLRKGADARVLEDPVRFRKVIETVFSGFKPLWKQTQMRAARDL